MRAANSSARSPAKTRWVWLSTKPGITQRPRGVEPLVRRPHRGLDRRDALALDHQRRIATSPSGPSPRAGSQVTSSPMRSIDERAHAATAAIASLSSRATSSRTWRPSRTTSAAVDDHVAHVGRGRGEDDGGEGVARGGSRRGARRRARRRPGRRGPRARCRPASGQPRQACPAAVAALSSAARGLRAALAARQPLVELDRARLLEEVDHGVRVAAERQRRAGPAQRARAADAVGEVALGRRADAAERRAPPSSATSASSGESHGPR